MMVKVFEPLIYFAKWITHSIRDELRQTHIDLSGFRIFSEGEKNIQSRNFLDHQRPIFIAENNTSIQVELVH